MSSLMVIEATRGPAWLGVKVTVITQLAPGDRLDPQVLLWLKSAALLPMDATPLIATARLPVLGREFSAVRRYGGEGGIRIRLRA